MIAHEHRSESTSFWALRSMFLVDEEASEERMPIGDREFLFSISMVSAALFILGLLYRLF